MQDILRRLITQPGQPSDPPVENGSLQVIDAADTQLIVKADGGLGANARDIKEGSYTLGELGFELIVVAKATCVH